MERLVTLREYQSGCGQDSRLELQVTSEAVKISRSLSRSNHWLFLPAFPFHLSPNLLHFGGEAALQRDVHCAGRARWTLSALKIGD